MWQHNVYYVCVTFSVVRYVGLFLLVLELDLLIYTEFDGDGYRFLILLFTSFDPDADVLGL